MSRTTQQDGPDEYQVLQEQQQAQGLLFPEEELPVPAPTNEPALPGGFRYPNDKELEGGFACCA